MKTTKTETGFARHRSESGFAVVLVFLIILGIAVLVGVSYFFGVNKIESNINIPTSTPIVSVLPTPNQAQTGDVTNWETYINTENGYTLKFPQDVYIRFVCTGEELTVTTRTEIDMRSSPVTVGECNRGGRYDLETKTYTTIQSEPQKSKYYNIVKKDVKIGGVSGMVYIYTFTNIEDGPYPKWYAEARVNENSKTYEIYFGDKDKLDLFYQILSTFKFTNSLSEPPKPISDLFSAINTKFNINLIPVEESQFYSTAGMVTKKSWKIDFVNTNLGKSLTTFLNTQLTTNNLESAGGAGGGVDTYENSQIKCNHVYGYKSGDPTNWKDPFNYLSCAEK